MKFQQDTCPECGTDPEYIDECTSAKYEIRRDEDGFDYTGESETYCDCTTTEPDVQGRATLTCSCGEGHRWETFLLDEHGKQKPIADTDQHRAVLKIHALMDGCEWSPDTLDQIAEILRVHGLEVRPFQPGEDGQ